MPHRSLARQSLSLPERRRRYFRDTIIARPMFDPAKIKKIAINTGGGDAPGLNAVIRAATLAAIRQGWEVY